MNFNESSEFTKDVKALKKRVPTLTSDLRRAKVRIKSLYVTGDNMTKADLSEFRKQFFSGKIATILPESTNEVEVIKMRLDTDTRQYKNKLRVVVVAIRKQNDVKFIELYSKNNKARENNRRIKKYRDLKS